MPSTAILFCALLTTAPPYGGAGQASRADYQAAFDEPEEGWAPPLAERPATRPSPAAHLPIGFGATRVNRRDPAVLPVDATEAAPARLPASTQSIALAPPTENASATPRRLPTASLPTVLGALGVVVCLFLGLAWLVRRGMPKGSGMLPAEVVEVLGRLPLAGRHQMHLLRLGGKLVLVSASQAGVETLSEVTDPLEVDRLTGLCYQAQPHSATASFRQVFQGYEAAHLAGAGRVGDRLDLSHLDTLAAPQRAPGRQS